MTKRLILMAGPKDAEGFLTLLAKAAENAAVEIDVVIGLKALSAYPRWASVEIAVPLAIACTARDLQTAQMLRAVIVPSLGYEGVDIAAATCAGVIAANGQAAENVASVAEAVIMFALMVLYDVRAAEQRLRDGQARTGTPVARMMRGRTIGIIGLGNIGRAVVVRLREWGVRVLVNTRTEPKLADSSLSFVSLEQLLAQSDVVIPLVPLTDETHHLLSRQRLAGMKEGAIIVNMSRGAIIDEAALADPELHARRGGIALDVFEQEPLPIDSPLRRLPRAILTSHEIAHTVENHAAIVDLAKTNIADALAGRRPISALNDPAPWRSQPGD